MNYYTTTQSVIQTKENWNKFTFCGLQQTLQILQVTSAYKN